MGENLGKPLKPDSRANNSLSLNLVPSNLKGLTSAYSIHQPMGNMPSPLSSSYPSSLNPESVYSVATSATGSSMDSATGMLQFDMKNPGVPVTTNGIPQNLAVAAAATAIGNCQNNSFAVQKQQALQAQFNNAMSAGSAKAVHQQVSMVPNPQFQQAQPPPHMFQPPQMFEIPQNMQGIVYNPAMQRPQMIAQGNIRQQGINMPMNEEEMYNLQLRIQQQQQQQFTQQQLKLQMQQMQSQQAQQLQFRNPQVQQVAQQQKQVRMLAPSMNPQFAFRPQPGMNMATQMGPMPVGNGALRLVKSSPMVNQLAHQMPNLMPNQIPMQMPNQMPGQVQNPMASPINIIPTSAPTNSLAAAAAAAALSARQNAYRNPSQPGTRVRRSFSTSSPLSQSTQASSPSQKAHQRIASKPVYSNGNTPTAIHFSNSDLSAAVLSPNSPTFQISQYPSPSTTISEIDGVDDGSSLMSPTVSPFMANMPAIRFPAEIKRPSTEYSVDEVMANAEHELNGGEKPKRRRSNAHGQLVRRLSSTSESGPAATFDVNSPGNSGSPPSGPTRKPPTPTQASANIPMGQRRSVSRYGSSPVMRSPITGSFSPTSSAAAPLKENATKANANNTSSAINTSFGSQGQQLVFPLNPIQGTNATFEHESIASFSGERKDMASGSGANSSSSNPRGRTRAVSGNGMGRFEVLTFHQYENHMTPEDKRLKQHQKGGANNGASAATINAGAAVPTNVPKPKKENVNSESNKVSSSSPVPKAEKGVTAPPNLLRASSLGPDGMLAKRVSMVKEEDEDEFPLGDKGSRGPSQVKSTDQDRPAESKNIVRQPEKPDDSEKPNQDKEGFSTETSKSSSGSGMEDNNFIIFQNGSEKGNGVYLFEGHDDTTIFNEGGSEFKQLDDDLNKFMDYSFDMSAIDGSANGSGNLLINDPMVVGDEFINGELVFDGTNQPRMYF